MHLDATQAAQYHSVTGVASTMHANDVELCFILTLLFPSVPVCYVFGKLQAYTFMLMVGRCHCGG